MIKQLEHKIALVTGANGGIGKEIAKIFLQNGAIVIANYCHKREGIDEIIKQFGEKIFPIQCDLSNPNNISEMFSQIKNQYGQLDILINNAGIFKNNLAIMVTKSEWDDLININLRGSFLCIQQAAKIMIKQKQGVIVNITSIVGLKGNKGQSVYSATKAGVIGLTKSLAKELGPFNIRVNAVAPGLIKTEMIEGIKPDIIEAAIKNTALNRLGSPEEVAKTVLFLSSTQSAFITGEIISIDGGLTI
jgi:3-oxoacyl-[acyl-carrier protein] reductase